MAVQVFGLWRMARLRKAAFHGLEAACRRAIATKVTSLKSIRLMLNKGLDQQPLPQEQTDELANITHANIRGNTYYQH